MAPLLESRQTTEHYVDEMDLVLLDDTLGGVIGCGLPVDQLPGLEPCGEPLRHGGAGVDGAAGPLHVKPAARLPEHAARPGARAPGLAIRQLPNGFCCWPNGLRFHGNVPLLGLVLVVAASSLVLPSVTSTVRSAPPLSTVSVTLSPGA